MNFEQLAEYYPQLPLAMVLGLILSISFRRSSWTPLVWIPTSIAFLTVSWLIFSEVRWLSGLRGPDSGWGGLQMLFLIPILGVCIVGIIVCFFCRPKSGWNLRASVPAIIVSIATLAYCYWNNESNVEIHVTDVYAKPISGVCLAYNNGPRNPVSDSLKFRLQKHQFLGVEVIADLASGSVSENSPSGCKLGFSSAHDDSSKLEVCYSFSRKIGFRHSLTEDFTEVVPFTHELQILLVLPPRGSLDPAPLKSKIRAAFDSISQKSDHRSLNYGDVCRNLEAVKFMPELIALFGENRALQFSVMEGLKSIAATLSDIDEGCRQLRKDMLSKNYPTQECHEKVRQLCLWANILDVGSSDMEALEKVRVKISDYSQVIVDFCLQEPQDPASIFKPPGILAELGELNRPHLKNFVQGLLIKPPADMQCALSWSSVFFGMRARESELRDLIQSTNPLLQAAARDARSD